MHIEKIKQLFGEKFVGREELKPFFEAMGFQDCDIDDVPINYNDEVLERAASEGYILILGVSHINENEISLRFIRDKFGVNPDDSEPCLYNQDWYMKEDFMDLTLDDRWYLIKKEVYENSRAIMPNDLENRGLTFPSAILCGYTFFAYYFACQEYLWWHDFVWCSDTDHNGDRIYVGKYHDIDGVNKNGFSVHRHLALRPCYGAIASI